MTLVDTAVRTVHLLVAALWVGAVVFVTVGVLPVARDGDVDAAPLERVIGRLTTTTRWSALVLLVTGGHLAGTNYTGESLVGTTPGRLVVVMVVLWVVMVGLVEAASSRLADALREKRVRAPARDYLRWYRAASLVGLLLLVDAGLIASGAV